MALVVRARINEQFASVLRNGGVRHEPQGPSTRARALGRDDKSIWREWICRYFSPALLVPVRLQFRRRDSLDGGIHHFDHVQHRNLLTRALQAGRDLHQTAGIGGNHQVRLG
jgi:hypothetical protein